MRVAIAGIMHESNSFNPVKTDLNDFLAGSFTRGPELIEHWRQAAHEMAGFIEGGRFGFELRPAVMATAIPSGPVAGGAFEELNRLLDIELEKAAPFEGLLLALHGAMFCEQYPDADGEIVARLRRKLGTRFPIVVTHDFHANISERVVQDSTALIAYKTCPHIDQRQCGLKAAELMARTIRGEIQPTQAIAKPSMLYNILYHNTSREPLKPILDKARQLEQSGAALAASVPAGYQYADVPECGPSAVVITDSNPARACRLAQELSAMLWESRHHLSIDLPDARTAVHQAMECESGPVVLVDMGDNVGGGSSADTTFLLAELLVQRAHGWVIVIHAPAAAQKAAANGVGRSLRLSVGSPAVEIGGRVRVLHEGTFLETQIRHGGARYNDQGLTAMIEIGGPDLECPSLLVLTSKRMPPFSLEQLISLGIDPARQKILVVKAAVAFRAAYEPIARRIIEVNTPGLTAIDPRHFTFTRLRRPIFPLDDAVEFQAGSSRQ